MAFQQEWIQLQFMVENKVISESDFSISRVMSRSISGSYTGHDLWSNG